MKKSKMSKLATLALSSILLTSCWTNSWSLNSEDKSQKTNLPIKDWSYSTKQIYQMWENQLYIDVNLDLENWNISRIEVVWDPNWKAALWYAQEFMNSLKDGVVWKSIDKAKQWWYLSWASMTSQAFSDALDNIKIQASN